MSVTAADFIKNVKTGDTAVVELATRDTEDGFAPDYRKPQTVILYVQRRTKAYKDRWGVHPAGELSNCTIQGGGWAEGGIDSWSEIFCEFQVENYRMHILSWNGDDVIPSQTV
jgi:hypothetical protein